MLNSVPNIATTREELVFQLRSGDAHLSFLDVVAEFPLDAINVRPVNVGYSFWHLVEHVRYCQFDMLDYLRNPSYRSGAFPDDYWPGSYRDASEQQWQDSVAAFEADLDSVESFVRDENRDLWVAAPQAWEPSHTPLRTVMVMIDHNAYHGGGIGVLRQVTSTRYGTCGPGPPSLPPVERAIIDGRTTDSIRTHGQKIV